jgi:hypothetical protein
MHAVRGTPSLSHRRSFAALRMNLRGAEEYAKVFIRLVAGR